MSWMSRHPLGSFVALAFALSWFAWPLYAAGLAPSPLFGAGPFLAAVVVVSTVGGKERMTSLLRSMVRWRISPIWYSVLLLPWVAAGAAAAANTILGADLVLSQDWAGLLPSYVLLLLIPGVGGAWEEPGWRGFYQPGLEERHLALVSALTVGVVWTAWHLPLWVEGIVPWTDGASVVAIAVVYAWILDGTGGSVFIVMLLHAMNNTVGELVLFTSSDSGRYRLLLSTTWVMVAVFVAAVSRPARLTRRLRTRLDQVPAERVS
jgi:membrane protease YdiL (CAAX protease family)